jgi:hypothetical protein
MSEKMGDSSPRKEPKMGRPKTPSHLETRRIFLTLNYKTRLFLELIKAHGTWTSDSEIVQNLIVDYVERHHDLFDKELLQYYEVEFHTKARQHAKEQMQKIVKEMQEIESDEDANSEK